MLTYNAINYSNNFVNTEYWFKYRHSKEIADLNYLEFFFNVKHTVHTNYETAFSILQLYVKGNNVREVFEDIRKNYFRNIIY